MELYEAAWKSIIRPTQVKMKPSAYGPKSRVIDDCAIVRTDL